MEERQTQRKKLVMVFVLFHFQVTLKLSIQVQEISSIKKIDQIL